MAYRLHLFPGLTLLLISLAIQFQLNRWYLRSFRPRRGALALILAADGVIAALLSLGYLLGFARVIRHVPNGFATWSEAGSLATTMGLMGVFLATLLWRLVPKAQPARRAFLRAGATAVVAAPYTIAGFGIVERTRFRLNEARVAIPNLPPDLDGVRLVQISDIHLSQFLNEREFARAIDMANETRAHLALVTGDLISRPGDPLDACLRQLARLRADAGCIGCLGNHEVYTQTEDYVTSEGRRIGIDFLRRRSRAFRFGNSSINFAGVDYQKFGYPYLVGAETLVRPGEVNILLSHNPDVFPVAASQGFDVTISGHTHGGQVNFEILHRNMNVARYFTPYVKGLYNSAGSAVYVCSGLGTIGIPVRVGAPPEVSLIRLCAS